MSEAVGSAYLPKLVGSYECELHGAVADIVSKDYDVIVDIGCAEGYYAIGFARALPKAQVYAFDTDALGRKLCQAMARENSVSGRVKVAGKCDASLLNSLLGTRRALVISDCEGCEYDLLRLDFVAGLKQADLLVELHNCVSAEQQQAFLKQFEATHSINLVDTQERHPADYPALSFLRLKQQHLAVNEFRNTGEQSWALITAKR